MSKAVLISIQPKWCELIANGKKTVEVRKSRPKLETPFKCYIYCTKAPKGWLRVDTMIQLDTKVIGEFVCDNIERFDVPFPAYQNELDKRIMDKSCLKYSQLHRYAGHNCLYGWNISNLVVYETPKELSEFHVARPPQSWCYVDCPEKEMQKNGFSHSELARVL